MTALPTGFRSLFLPAAQLSLAAVLKCGQSFRWTIFPLASPVASAVESPSHNYPTHEYRLCLRDRVVCLRQIDDILLYRAVFPKAPGSEAEEALRDSETVAWIRDYFQLDVDLIELYKEWSQRDKVFDKLKDRFSGIRMLRQDPWENLTSFICSSNNHISRITGMVKSLCKQYSLPLLSLPPPDGLPSPPSPIVNPTRESAIPTADEQYYPFPPPSALADPSVSTTLRSLGFGYRADFIQRTAKMLVDEHNTDDNLQGGREASERWLMTLRDLDTGAAREELLKFVGVGRKVADCILLMSLDKREVIPVDTHVHQIAIKHYGLRGPSGSKAKANMTPKLYDEVNNKLASVWGHYAGWAHSVLFTADLKSFASYGLSSPLPSPTKVAAKLSDLKLQSRPPTPSSSIPRKRGRAGSQSNAAKEEPSSDILPHVVLAQDVAMDQEQDTLSMIDRIKRRKRAGKSRP